MKQIFHYLLTVVIVTLLASVESCIHSGRYDNELRLELLQMVKEDQQTREKTSQANFADSALMAEVVEIDQKNTARMREIVNTYGWPSKGIVGKDGAHAAWLLVQHADLDHEFQKRCLKLMKEAAKKGEVSMKLVAYLTDRVLVAEGEKQIYGTQFETKNGELVPLPIEDEANVDKRRKEVGLPSLEEYKKMMMKMYQSEEPNEK
jgi:hypothetical protein